MSATITPFTQAFNFYDADENRVDPRTGLFRFNLPLGQVCGNNTLGPRLPLALNYSPLRIGNLYQLGNGISLGLTTYDRPNRILELGSGQRFRTDDAGGEASPVVRQQTHDAIRLVARDGKIMLALRSGECQILAHQGGGIYLPESIKSPLGYTLKLLWQTDANHHKLTAIIDSQNETVCGLTYGVGTVDITLWPQTAESVSYQLEVVGEYLAKVANVSLSPNLTWRFAYESDPQVQIEGQSPLKQIVSPIMLEESVQ